MRYFRVSQNSTWSREKEGFLWSPKLSKSGADIYKSIRDAKKDDMIFHFYNGTIKAVSIVEKPYVEATRPHESENWTEEGYILESRYLIFNESIELSNYRNDVVNIINKNSEFGLMGFTSDGQIRQVYLSEISEELAVLLLSIIRENNDPTSYEVKSAIDHFESNTSVLFHDDISYVEDIYEDELSENEKAIREFNIGGIEDQRETKLPISVNKKLIYPRDRNESAKAIIRGDFKCSVDVDHQSFISNSTQRQYMEAHHIIPFSYQPNFDLNLDREGNIASLCPNCHRRIHLGTDNDKIELLTIIYSKFKDRLSSIIEREIGFEELLNYYNIHIDE